MWIALLTVMASELPVLKVDLLEGRAQLATPHGVEQLRPERGAREHDGPGYLEAGALARLHMRWSGAASVELGGACALEWRASPGESGALSLAFARLDSLSLEVRRGPVRLELPGGWRLRLAHGAAFVRALPGGAFELEHAAGAPLLLTASRSAADVRPPWTVLPGAKLRLEPRAERPLAGDSARLLNPLGQPSRRAREPLEPPAPWAGFSWPWSDSGAPAVRGRESAPVGPRPRGALLELPPAPSLKREPSTSRSAGTIPGPR